MQNNSSMRVYVCMFENYKWFCVRCTQFFIKCICRPSEQCTPQCSIVFHHKVLRIWIKYRNIIISCTAFHSTIHIIIYIYTLVMAMAQGYHPLACHLYTHSFTHQFVLAPLSLSHIIKQEVKAKNSFSLILYVRRLRKLFFPLSIPTAFSLPLFALNT